VDYSEIEAFLIGQCGKTQREAALTTFSEYRALMQGKAEQNRTAWEVARWRIWWEFQLSPNIKPEHKPREMTGICVFPWEADEYTEKMQNAAKTAEISEETQNALRALFGAKKES